MLQQFLGPITQVLGVSANVFRRTATATMKGMA
jgi:hypothetical protein